MKQIQLLGLSFLLISLIACEQTVQKNTENETQNGWKALNESSYSIQYPENWELDKSGKMGTSLVLLSKLSSPQDKFRDNVNLLIQDLQGQNINLDKYVEISEGQIKTMVVNGNLIESKRLSENGSEFQKIIYTGDQGAFKLKYEQFYWIKNGKAYVLTLTCEFEEFETYKVTGEKILNSFRLK
ncbi:MAG: hypothetical protein WCP69_15795 [Bacteroidota bacterium]